MVRVGPRLLFDLAHGQSRAAADLTESGETPSKPQGTFPTTGVPLPGSDSSSRVTDGYLERRLRSASSLTKTSLITLLIDFRVPT